jgi:hypothetical protein
MDRTLKIYIVLLIFVIAGIVYIDINKPKPIDWSPTYSIKDKIPLGMYVFNEEIGGLLKNQTIEKIEVSPYEYFINDFDYENSTNLESDSISAEDPPVAVVDTTATPQAHDFYSKGTFMNIEEYSDIDKESVNEICKFVSRGNTVFLSNKQFSEQLLDTLKLEMQSEFNFKDSTFNWVANPKLGKQKYTINEGANPSYFSKFDTINSTVLGYQTGDSTRVNFIKVKFNSGTFLLHSQPASFTNFHLLKDNHGQYAQKVLSYIPKGTIFWNIKNQTGKVISDSPLAYWLSQPALRYAWQIFLIGMIIFMIFNAKRKQRIVPIIKPLENTTLEFTKTIGNLYYQEGDHDNIINKKIIYFLERIRNQYLIDTSKLDDDFVKKLHQKSGKNLVDIQKVIYLINAYKKSPHSSVESDLIEMNNAIEKMI